jgi:hypothetical protein
MLSLSQERVVRNTDPLLPLATAGLLTSLPLFFIICDSINFEKTQAHTVAFQGFWIILGVAGLRNRRSASFNWSYVPWATLAFWTLYYVDWALWPKGTELDELMWAYSVVNAIVPFVFCSCFERKDLRIFLTWASIFGGILSAIVLGTFIAGRAYSPDVDRFTVVEYLNPITQSLVIGQAVLILYFQAQTRLRALFYALIAPMLFAMILGGSRGPAISLGVAIVLTSLLSKSRETKKSGIVVIVLVVVGMLIYLPQLLLDRYFSSDKWLTTETEEGMPLRIDRLSMAINRWIAYPFLGSGTSYNVVIYYSHNLFVQILMEMGVVGLALFLVMFIPLTGQIFKTTTRSAFHHSEVATVVGLFIYHFIETQFSGTFMTDDTLWLSLGLLTMLPRLLEEVSPPSSLQTETPAIGIPPNPHVVPQTRSFHAN